MTGSAEERRPPQFEKKRTWPGGTYMTGKTRRYDCVLFDLDGTLTESGEGVMGSAAYAFTQLGLPVPPPEELRTMVGPPLRASFLRLGVPGEKVEEAIALYRDEYNNRGGKLRNGVYPGIVELLEKLKGIGCRLYVATSKPETVAREVLERFRLDRYLERIAGASLDHSRESKADVLRHLLETVEKQKKAVLVGDTIYDVLGARELGLPCIGVNWGYGEKRDMEEAGAETIVETPEELFAYLTGPADGCQERG